eukprot:8845103-Lingulodinium_polyedra.AAC.1
MMRAHGQHADEEGVLQPTAPAFQCAAPALVYQADNVGHEVQWHSSTMEQIVKIIRNQMPEELREGWRQMHMAHGVRDTWEV